jgi:hypothetical protein
MNSNFEIAVLVRHLFQRLQNQVLQLGRRRAVLGQRQPIDDQGRPQSGIEYARDSFVAGASLCGVAEDYPQRIEWSDAASHAAWRSALFANDLDQHALAAPSVELAIKNLLPRTEVEFTRRDRDHNLPPHNLAFHMGIGIVLAGSVVTVA